MINWASGDGRKMGLRLPVLLVIRLRLHPKTSDSATMLVPNGGSIIAC